MKITRIEMDQNPDLGELYILINSSEPRPAISYLVDDDRNFYLRVDPETDQVVGASVLFANDWLDEIAEAFRERNFDHPDIRFFLEEKIKALAEQLPDEIRQAQAKEAAHTELKTESSK